MKEYIVSLSQVKDSFLEECLELALEWKSNGCADITCVLNDDQTEVKILVPDHCVDSCVDLKITCTTCKSVEVRNIRVCPCDSDDDCPKPCETCGPLGYCISNCPDDEICTDNGCGDCDDNNPCLYPFICEDNKCVCEDGYKVGKECWPCNPEDPNGCPPGQRCTKNGCVDICTDKEWSEDLQKCVDCTVNSHCEGIKICDPEGNCVCPEGYYEDPNDSDNCLEIGCTEDDPDNCLECDLATGILSPKQCAKGWFMKAGTCDCVKECECGSGPCDEKAACVKDISGRCYCDECEEVVDPKSQEDCCEGFYWNGTDCVVNPCKGTCANGCEEGCICEGELCIPDDGSGGDDGCLDNFTSEYEDCVDDGKLVTELSLDSPCECDELTVNTKLTSNTISGDDNILSFKMEIRKGHGDSTNYLGLPMLDEISHASITDNELPVSGMVSLEVVVYYNILNDDGIIIGESHEQAVVYPSNIGASITNKAFYEFDNVKVPVDGTLYDENKVVKSVVLGIVKTSNWFFHSQCNYKGEQVLASYVFNKNLFTDHLVGDLELIRVTNLMSLSPRNPIFSYFLSEDSNYEESESIRKGYIAGVGNIYKDLVYGPGNWGVNKFFPLDTPEGRILSNMNLLVTNDCGCPDASVIDHGKLVVCSPCVLDASVMSCGKSIVIVGSFDPDPINQDLTQFDDHKTGNKYISNHPSQVKWELVVNGSNVIATFIHDKVKGMIEVGTGTTMFAEWLSTEKITSAFLRHIHDATGKCTMEIPVEYSTPEITESIDCVNNTTYKVVTSQSTIYGNIMSVEPSNVAVLSGGNWNITLNHKVDSTIRYVFANGCVLEKVYNHECCGVLPVIKTIVTGSNVRVYSDVTGGTPPYTYKWVFDGVTYTTEEIILNVEDQGEITLEVTDSNGCVGTDTYLLRESQASGLNIVFDTPLCDNETTQVSITLTSGSIGTVSYYIFENGSPNGNGVASILPGQPGIINGVSGNSTVVFTDLYVDGVLQIGFSETIVIEGGTGGTITVTAVENSICVGGTIELLVSGPSGSVVTVVSTGANPETIGTYTLGGIPYSLTLNNTTVSGVNTYVVTGVSGNCPLTSGNVSVSVSAGENLTITQEPCVSGQVKIVFSAVVSSVTDLNGNVLTVAPEGTWMLIAEGIVGIIVTPSTGCLNQTTFVVGTDWNACGCIEYGLDIGYETYGGPNPVAHTDYNTPFVIEITQGVTVNIDLAHEVISGVVFSSCTGGWTGIPSGANVLYGPSNLDAEIENLPVGVHTLYAHTICSIDGITNCVSEVVAIHITVISGSFDVNILGDDDCTSSELLSDPQGGTGPFTYYWTLDGDYDNPIITQNLDVSLLNVGVENTIELKMVDSAGKIGIANTVFTPVDCPAINMIFAVDDSGSIDTLEWADITAHVTSLSNTVSGISPTSTFTAVQYAVTSNITVPTSTTPIPLLVNDNAVGSTANIQDMINWLLNTGMTAMSLNGALPTKLFIYSDEWGAGTGMIGDSWLNLLDPNDNVLPGLGMNFMTYTYSDLLKAANIEIYVIRYPFGDASNASWSPANQAISDELFGNVASPSKLFLAEYNQNPTDDIIAGLDCDCD